MHIRKKHNAAILPWLRAISENGGSLLLNATEVDRRHLYWLGAMWAEERGLIVRHNTVDVISHNPRRYGYSLTKKGARAARVTNQSTN